MLSRNIQRGSVLILLAVGLAGWALLFGRLTPQWDAFLILGPWGFRGLVWLAVIVTIASAARPLRMMLGGRRNSSGWASAAAGVGMTAYLCITAITQHRAFFPYVHDECSYLIQAHQIAHGHLWYAGHPLGRFFDSFQLLTDGVYASAYFPGTAILHAVGIWLHLQPWMVTALSAGAVAGLLHWIVRRMVDGIAAWMAVLLLGACQMFRTLSIITVAQIPLLLYGLAATAAWVKWREHQRKRWALCSGILLGLAAITRPVDALCFAIPLGIAVLVDALRRPKMQAGLIFGVIGLVPALSVQLISNYGITGHLLTTPFRVYADRDYPNSSYGFHRYDPSARPVSDLPQKQALYQEYLREIERHQSQNLWQQFVRYRLPLTLSVGGAATPFPLLAVLLPASLMGMGMRRWVMVAGLPLFLLLYVPYPFFFPGYTVVAAPVMVVGILIVVRILPGLWPRWREGMMAWGTLMVSGVAVAALPQLDATVRDDLFDAPLIREANRQLAMIQSPAVVLFRYSSTHNLNEEPVYNNDVAWPDDARIIRAHDRGGEDRDIYSYYAQRQPERVFYCFDEQGEGGTLVRLGTAREMAAAFR